MTEATATEKLTLESLLSRFNMLASAFEKLQQDSLEREAEFARKEARYQQIIQEKDQEILRLTYELRQLKKMFFGPTTERYAPGAQAGQLSLELDQSEGTVQPALQKISYTRKEPAADKARHPGRLPLPASLPRQQILIEPARDVSGWKKIGEEITEELEYAPGKLFVKQYIRPKYVHPDVEGVACGDLPERPITKGIAGPALLAYIIISKFVNHMPLYRQIEQFKREGITIPSSTINDWLSACCTLLEPLYQRLVSLIQFSDYTQADETPLDVLDKSKKGGKAKGYQWLYHAPLLKLVLFDYRPGRGREGPLEILNPFNGYLQSDGYQAYDVFDKKEGITRLCCWAHARRKYSESVQNDPARAEYVLAEIQKLYALERKAKERELNYEQIRELRQKEALPVLTSLKDWLIRNYSEVLPGSPIGKAMAYTLSLWDKLVVYVQDGRLQPDNNLIENAVRPLALGRRNFLFAGSHEGARRMAMIYSFMGSCKKNNINPQDWLTDVLIRIPSHHANKLDELLPHQWIPSEKQ